MKNVRFLPAGDTAVAVEFGNEISKEVNARVHALNTALMDSGMKGIVEMVPTYRSLMVHYDPGVILYDELVEETKSLLGRLDHIQSSPSSVLEIPVLYGGETGPDLDFVATYSGKTPQEVVEIHSSTQYLIYMLGFTPGFAYLGGMSKDISAPRLEKPRVTIPAGSVGIAGTQTGIYPMDSPGGWRLIGRTPVRLYDPEREEPILLRAGEYIQFTPISCEEYDAIAAQVEAGTYMCRRFLREEGRI